MNKRDMLTFAAAVVIPLTIIMWLGVGEAPRSRALEVGETAPELTLIGLDNEGFLAANYRDKPKILNFWATWCPPCVTEHPVLQEAAKVHGNVVSFIGILYQDQPEAARAWLARHGSNFSQYLDPDSRTALRYVVSGVPETVFIDAQGRIRYKHVGPIDAATLTRELRLILPANAP